MSVRAVEKDQGDGPLRRLGAMRTDSKEGVSVAHGRDDGAERAQAELVAAFAAGEVAGAAAPIEHIETHLSHVFLAGQRVFKLKRAKKLPFVDFSSLEQRRAACEAELAVNQRMAASLYVGVSSVMRNSSGRFALSGEGAIVDWVVVMRRFDQSQQFDELARAGRLTDQLVERAAEAVAALHLGAPPDFGAGRFADYRRIIESLRLTATNAARRQGQSAEQPGLFDDLEAELTHVRSLIEQRREQGKVRRGHGDLHLRNICMFEGEPTPFDALEFDEALATTDVLYDIAFLLMDLNRVGLRTQANAALNRYWDATMENEEALQLLPFFTALRAAVRMAVAVEAGDLAEADIYRTLGGQLLARRAPLLVAIGGLSGSGKSSVAAALAPLLPGPAGARLLRSDVLRKRSLGLSVGQPAGSDAYTAERRAEVYDDLAARAAIAVCAGASVVADATFFAASAREAIAGASGGATAFAYWLDAPLDVRLARVSGRSFDASDADAAVAAAQQAPRDLTPTWRRLDADRSVGEVVSDIMADITAAERPRQ